ncbi:MAG: TlpA family protein disulfide reductase [Dehalococcoidia bacterium]
MTMQQKAPEFTLAHIEGRQVSLSDFRAHPVVLLFSGRESEQQGVAVEHALRGRYTSQEVPLVGVPDLHGVPRLLRAVAKNAVQSSYKKATEEAARGYQAAGKPVPQDLSQEVILLPDWDGKVVSSYGLTGVDKQAVAIVVDAQGNIKGQASGPQASERVLTLVEQALAGR